MQTERLPATLEGIARAAQLLRSGKLVAFPTETVYGLGANALDAEAVAKIFAAKQRPAWDPLIVHIASAAQLSEIATASQAARILMDHFWPGPLTLLLPRTQAIPDAVTAGRPLVGVRIPKHPVALELLRQTGLPVAAPSANTFGHTSPTTAAHVLADLDGRIAAVLDGGPTDIGLESTVIGFDNRWDVTIYRPGAIDETMLEQHLGGGCATRYQPAHDLSAIPAALPSPGVCIRHYAPRARLLLVDHAKSQQPIETSLAHTIDDAQTETSVIGVMLPEGWDRASATVTFPWGPWGEPAVLAQRLYAGLRHLDDQGCTMIVCPVPYSPGIADALRDRLQKAARTK